MRSSRSNRLSGRGATGFAMAFALVFLGAGCSGSADADMGMKGGGMMAHGGMHQMMDQKSDAKDESSSSKQEASSAESEKYGARVYTYVCSMCHRSGVAGAPKMGDDAEWAKRIKKGRETLYDHAINGYRGMPAKGGRMSMSDDQIKDAVNYMVEHSGGWGKDKK